MRYLAHRCILTLLAGPHTTFFFLLVTHHCVPIPSTLFAIILFPGFSSRVRPLRLGAPAFGVSAVGSPAFSFVDSKKLLRIRFRFLPQCFVSLRFRPPAAHGIVSPSVSSALCTRLQCLWHCFASLHLAYFKIPFRVRFVPLLFDLRHRIVSFRLSCLQLHSTSTFSIHLVARSCDLPEGG
jgi:hypothetical protein